MVELTYQECMEVNGGKISTVIGGIGVAVLGIAILATSEITVPLALAGLVIYHTGAGIAITGAVEK